MHDLEGAAVLLGSALPPQGELGLGQHARERCSQLVRELGREALLAPEARREPVEEAVERCRELGQLVVGLAEPEAAVEVALAPARGLAGHPRDGAERGREEPAGADRDEEQNHRSERERRQERRSPRLLVRRQRDRSDHRPDAAAADDDRLAVELRVADVERTSGLTREARRGRADPAARPRRLERPASGEDPDLRVAGSDVGRFADDEAAVGVAKRPEFRRSPRPYEALRVSREAVGEEGVEARDRRRERDRDRDDDDEQEPAPDPEPAHRTR